jgi:hypothetical protein
MKAKLAIVVFLVASIIVVVGITTSQNLNNHQLKALEDKEKRDKLSIKERAELAKIRGKKQVTAPGIVTLHPVAASPEEIEQLLPKYTIILAELVEEFSSLSDPRTLQSWYKFKTLDTLSQAPPQQSFAVREVPAQLQQLKDDEFLVPGAGGALTVDGVEVIQNDETIPRFKKNRKYLLLLSLNPATRIAELALGPQSILPVQNDHSLDSTANEHQLQQAIRKFHNSSLDQLKRNIRK